MTGQGAIEYLKDLCAKIDGRAKVTLRRTVVVAAFPVAAGFCVACYGMPMEDYESDEYTCSDGYDNDGNGLTDCADPGCSGVSFCGPEVCGDGRDNDGDSTVDCDDPDCASLEACLSYYDPEEGWLVGSCTDDADNDGNGAADCSDPSCASGEICSGTGACGDGVDNDGDGLYDCYDPDCGREPVCN